MIISWCVRYVDRKTKATNNHYECDIESLIGNSVFKKGERFLYVNTDDLSPKDKIAFDIAIKRYDELKDASYFIKLREFFVEGDYKKIPNITCVKCITAHNYFEDEDKRPLTFTQFIAALEDKSERIMTFNRVWVPKDLPENVARELNIAELIKIKESDFNFSEENIETLNTYVTTALKLKNSSLLIQVNPIVLSITGQNFSVVKNMTDEQFNASLLEFRKLWMQNEPGNFIKTVKILTDKRIVLHPLKNYIAEVKKQYDAILGKTVSINETTGIVFSKTFMNPSWLPSGDELIRAMIYVDCIHSGDKRNIDLKAKIFNVAPAPAVVEFAYCNIVRELSSIMVYVGDVTFSILKALKQLTVTPPKRRISNAEIKFFHFFDEKVIELAQIMLSENNCSLDKLEPFKMVARCELEKQFGIENTDKI